MILECKAVLVIIKYVSRNLFCYDSIREPSHEGMTYSYMCTCVSDQVIIKKVCLSWDFPYTSNNSDIKNLI